MCNTLCNTLCYSLCYTTCSQGDEDELSDHELSDHEQLAIGAIVYIPHAAFPNEDMPPNGYWIGKTVTTNKGGTGDIGIKVPGEPVFTRPKTEVINWLTKPPAET